MKYFSGGGNDDNLLVVPTKDRVAREARLNLSEGIIFYISLLCRAFISNSAHFRVSSFPIQLAEWEMRSKLKMIMPVCLYFVFYLYSPPYRYGTKYRHTGMIIFSFSSFPIEPAELEMS